MHFCCLLLSFAFLSAAALAQDKGKSSKGAKESGDSHAKEELGVNQFTTPGIDLILHVLQELRPVPYDSVAREVPADPPGSRPELALSAGGVIADGFLAVVAEKQSRIEPIGRSLLKHAKGLGVGDYVTKHSRSILEMTAQKDWNGIRSELALAQRDVEKGMMALRDEEIAHLVALGGWWRGLEITASIVAGSHTPERAALLVQPAILDYFADRMSTLNPKLKTRPIFVMIETNLREVRAMVVKDDRSPPTLEEVKKIRDLAKATNAAVIKPQE